MIDEREKQIAAAEKKIGGIHLREKRSGEIETETVATETITGEIEMIFGVTERIIGVTEMIIGVTETTTGVRETETKLVVPRLLPKNPRLMTKKVAFGPMTNPNLRRKEVARKGRKKRKPKGRKVREEEKEREKREGKSLTETMALLSSILSCCPTPKWTSTWNRRCLKVGRTGWASSGRPLRWKEAFPRAFIADPAV